MKKIYLKLLQKYSPENFHEIKIFCLHPSPKLSPEELESFFTSWASRIPQKPISFAIVVHEKCPYSLDKSKKNMEIIERYIKLGIIKSFKVLDYNTAFQ